MAGSPFGINPSLTYPTSQANPFGLSPYSPLATTSSPLWPQQYGQPIQQILQMLQIVPQQLQQLQQLQYAQQHQLQHVQQLLQVIPAQLAQLQQSIQFVPQQVQQLQQLPQAQQSFGSTALSGFAATPWSVGPQAFGQSGQVM